MAIPENILLDEYTSNFNLNTYLENEDRSFENDDDPPDKKSIVLIIFTLLMFFLTLSMIMILFIAIIIIFLTDNTEWVHYSSITIVILIPIFIFDIILWKLVITK